MELLFLRAVFFFGAAFFLGALFFFFGALFFLAAAFFGTLAPSFLASDKPMAIACLRWVTYLPLRPLFSFPSFISSMTFFTLAWLFGEYFAIR